MICSSKTMGEVTLKETGLLPKISSLFNSRIFSDVEFVFKYDAEKTQKIYGHKLILSLRSKVFASKFFDTKESPCEVMLPASKKLCFTHLLRFLYTDDVHFHSFEEAQELYELAHDYAVEELIEKCAKYMLHENLTIVNIFAKYECALRKNMQMLLKDCQNFICSNTQLVFDSDDFTSASIKVVEDIVKLDNLSVSSELEIIGAVLKWGSEELKRKKIVPDEKYLRQCIDPLMKYMRFLTLSLSEFDYFIENFNIFTGYESSILTRKIYNPECIVDFPESLCSITTKRAKKHDPTSMSAAITVKNIFDGSPSISTSPELPSARVLPVSVANSTCDSPSKISPPVSSIAANSSRLLHPRLSNHLELAETAISKVSYQVKKYSAFNESSVLQSQLKPPKFCSTPNLVDKKLFPPSAVHSIHLREFEFPVLESEPCLGTSFPKDVKSSVFFKMRAGNICLYGFELKVKNNNRKEVEEFEIDVDLRGFSKQPFSHQFKEELNGNILTVKFPKKMILQEGCKGVLDVSIDNLLLNRCNICDINDKGITLNIGLDFACEISPSSTQKTGNNYIFLISKLIYVPVKNSF